MIDEYDDSDDPDNLPCTWCGGDGLQENDDPLWFGGAYEIPCQACNGTGKRSSQWVF